MYIDSILAKSPVIPVLTLRDPEQAVPLARALFEGGLPVLEVTLRTSGALQALGAIKRALPDALVGAGTVIDGRQVADICEAGADFVVSPGCTSGLLSTVLKLDVPFLPGVTTPSEVMCLLEQGITAMKFFPAEAAGGIAMLKALSGPLPQVTFCPTGGIGPENAADYLMLDNVACVGGSWMVPDQWLEAERWDLVEARATTAALMGTRSQEVL